MTTGVLEGFLKGDRCRYDDGSVRNLLQSTVAAVARDITLVTLRNLIFYIYTARERESDGSISISSQLIMLLL